ncbi:MAG: GIY-YIG nuclease family protein [Cyanobacteriota bacterium]|nr:GIY-YIG nuclease family protein [Cyanobacteriota bacterium]
METARGQGHLFPNQVLSAGLAPRQELILSRDLLQSWQRRIQGHQADLFQGEPDIAQQSSLFGSDHETVIDQLKPLQLTPLPLSFWRWPNSPHHGPAVYLVMDRPADLNTPLLLYVGETIAADRRWKGEHDCKAYLAAYAEALAKAGLTSQLSIRFWSDVPESTKARRQLEQQLIQRWLPPFNKETRARWSTPFTAECS